MFPLLACVRCASGDSDDGELCSTVRDHRRHREDCSPFNHEHVWPVRLKGEWVSEWVRVLMEKQKMKDCATVWRRAWCANWQPKQIFLLYANHKTAALNGSLYVNRSCSDVGEKHSYLVEVFLGKVIAMYIIRKGGDFVFVIYMQQKPWRGRCVFRGLAWRFTPAVFVVWLVMAFTTARTESSSRWGTQSSHHNSAVVCNKASLKKKRKDNVFGKFLFFFSILTKLLGCRSH